MLYVYNHMVSCSEKIGLVPSYLTDTTQRMLVVQHKRLNESIINIKSDRLTMCLWGVEPWVHGTIQGLDYSLYVN